jgi:hypothetical protein
MSTTSSHKTADGNPSGPRIARILIPPSLPPLISSVSTQNPASLANAALQALQPRTAITRNTKSFPKHITLHPSQSLVAYVLQSADSKTASSQQHKMLCVQHTVTQQILWSVAWPNVAAEVFSESDPTKWNATSKALGQIVGLKFYDSSTLYWSGMASTAAAERWQGLAVQTANRILVLNLRSGGASHVWPTKQQQPLILAHLSESTVGAIPSTNAMPLTSSRLLVGCSDGTLKAFDRNTQQTVKSIKGLGKGDWMVQLVAANPYSAPKQQKRRMITVTKKGAAYLIELEVSDQQLEIRPPLARFVGGGWPETNTPELEHSLIQYDAHRDWVLWCQPSAPTPVLHVWNLQALQQDILQADPGGGGLKPDPTLQIQVVGGAVVEATQVVGTAFGDSTCSILLAAVSQTGALVLQGAAVPQRPTALQAAPVVAVQLEELLLRDAGIDVDLLPTAEDQLGQQQQQRPELPGLRVHAVKSQALGPTSYELVVATNIGIIIVQVPVPPMTGARHLHFGAGLGSLGKSMLQVQGSNVVYASLDTLTANPSGAMDPKNPVDVYTSLPPVHLPGDIAKKVPFRAGAYTLLPSPSGQYVALVWHAEYKYEILHIATLLQTVGQARGANSIPSTGKPCVGSGTGTVDFCWVGDNDVYALLHFPGWEQAALELLPETAGDASHGVTVGNLLGNVAQSATSATMAATSKTLSVTKAATSKTLSATKAATSKTLSSTLSATKTASKGMKKFGLLGRKKRRGKDDESSMAGSVGFDDDASDMASTTSMMSQMTTPTIASMPAEKLQNKKRYVELRELIAVEAKATELGHTMTAATSSSLGELTLRGGNRNLPMVLFGGPVLCIGCRSENSDDAGFAHFYTRKADEKGARASAYSSTGPTLPYPELCTWDDDGRLCAVAVDSRVAVYLSEDSEFVLLGTVRIGSPSLAVAQVTSLKFVHGVLYCCTWNSVHCVLLGDTTGGLCRLDTYLLASSDVAVIPTEESDGSLAPKPVILPLAQPVVIGYQSGSLVLSTLRGVFAVPLHHPLLRIGILLSSGQVDRAAKWLDAVPNDQHEALAFFLERRGHSELALLHLPGLSLETVVDLCMRHGDIARLEEVVEMYGARGLRAIDMGRGIANGDTSVTLCVGAYLLAHGRLELVRRLASECLRYDEQGKKDAFFLGALLLPVDESDASRLINRAVEHSNDMTDWPVGKFVHDHVLKK